MSRVHTSIRDGIPYQDIDVHFSVPVEVDLTRNLTPSNEGAYPIPGLLVKYLLGGKWPDGRGTWWEGFGFDCVSHWEVIDGDIHPMDGGGMVPGPSFRLIPLDY